MTEAEWLAATDTRNMLVRRNGMSERKLVLFGCACCRRHWTLIPDECCHRAIETAEKWADRIQSQSELQAARERVEATHPNLFWTAEFGTCLQLAVYFATFDGVAADEHESRHPLGVNPKYGDKFDDMLSALKYEVGELVAHSLVDGGLDSETVFSRELAAQCDLVRDIFGNPFRPITLDPSWLTPTVLALANGIYEEKAFDRMPILADALQDSGCTNEDILNHCRGLGPHTRGCWAIDLILSKC